MELEFGFLDKLKFGYKFFSHRFGQYRRTTNETIVAQTAYGPVKGVKRFSVCNDAYFGFEGIPFGKPPLGELRFRAPQPPEPWTEVRDCTSVAAKPLQVNMFNVQGSEDCLYLNVYTKDVSPGTRRPVMVWIYGGGFQVGEASGDMYSPDYLMSEDIVFVAIAYRLGAFGFLSLDDPSLKIPGNAGLKDQVLALKWVRENCEKFGGDPNNITIFGESAGGASAHYMTLTEKTKGLFHKAICQSGTALCDWANVPRRNWAHRLAVAMGYKGEESDKAVFEFLSKADGNTIAKAGDTLLTEEEKAHKMLFSLGPVVEPYVGEDCVVPKSPREMLETTWSNEIPIVFGGTSDEGLLCYPSVKKNPKILSEVNDCEYIVPEELGLEPQSEECKTLGRRLKVAHYGDQTPGPETMYNYLDIMSYKYFWQPIHRTVLARLQYASAPTYLYRFDFDSAEFNFIRAIFCGKEVRGVAHGDDCCYLFHGMFTGKLPKKSREYNTMRRMVGMWTKFAADGNPNLEETASDKWEPLGQIGTNSNGLKCWNISDELKTIDLPDNEKFKAWQSLYEGNQIY